MRVSTKKIWHWVAASWLLFSISSAVAAISPPPSFDVNGTRAVYIDVSSARYDITFDVVAKTAAVKATLNFSTTEQGTPLFDSVHEPTSIRLDGKLVSNTLVPSPDAVTQYRMLGRTLQPGQHRMVIEAPLSTGVAFDEVGVRAGFFMSDGDDRSLLEKYLPANLEFDQYPMTFMVTIANASDGLAQDFFTNGEMAKLPGKNQWRIQFPDKYTSSSPYFHTAPTGIYEKLETSFVSISGNEVPVLIYAKVDTIAAGLVDLNMFLAEVSPWFESAEQYYGPWLHSGIVIYAVEDYVSGSTGDVVHSSMEYCGATITSLSASTHELSHSYFGRGYMPVNGDAGWLDEAMAMWSGDPYMTKSSNTAYSSMGNRSPYVRVLDYDGYGDGRRFIRYLAYLVDAKNGKYDFYNFLRNFAQTNAFVPTSTQDFQGQIETYLGTDLQYDFDQAVYGVYGEGSTNYRSSKRKEHNPFHKSLTPEQLRKLL